jgi:chromatin remodeling complex protein RSC6
LEKPHGTKMSRRQVTLDIFDYAKENCAIHKRIIYTDTKLRVLLKVQAVSFRNFQKALDDHF